MSDKIIQFNEGAIKNELKDLVRNSVEETLNGLLEQEAEQLTQAAKYERTNNRKRYTHFPFEHWLKIRTNNAIERVNREIRRRTRVVGCFPDGNLALMLVCARLRSIA